MASTSKGTPSLPVVHAGFIPLVDCAPLVVARELGFDVENGLELRLHREMSWANIRDKIDVGALDCAHMLAPMPLAATLGLARSTRPVIAPMALSLNGNAITVSLPLLAEMQDADGGAVAAGGMAAARAVRRVVTRRQAIGREPLTFGMVYPFSSHNYDLRCWLASAGIDPETDVNLVVVPPPLMVASLKSGRVDGFCVGAPWNSLAVAEGSGAIVATKHELWAASPEKVLGVREQWARTNGDLLGRLVRALVTAARWLDVPANRPEAARLLAGDGYVGVPEELLMLPLSGQLRLGGGLEREVGDMLLFHRDSANFPWRSHAVWFLSQMIRWGHAREPFDVAALAARVYRADLFREAVAGLPIDVPAVDIRREDPSRFFAGEVFDSSRPLDYLAQLEIKSAATELAGFSAFNR
ncbi:MAG: CmpA/NrtA family ABC transporter substrate-binding protein [Hyphomicrobium sp.]